MTAKFQSVLLLYSKATSRGGSRSNIVLIIQKQEAMTPSDCIRLGLWAMIIHGHTRFWKNNKLQLNWQKKKGGDLGSPSNVFYPASLREEILGGYWKHRPWKQLNYTGTLERSPFGRGLQKWGSAHILDMYISLTECPAPLSTEAENIVHLTLYFKLLLFTDNCHSLSVNPL